MNESALQSQFAEISRVVAGLGTVLDDLLTPRCPTEVGLSILASDPDLPSPVVWWEDSLVPDYQQVRSESMVAIDEMARRIDEIASQIGESLHELVDDLAATCRGSEAIIAARTALIEDLRTYCGRLNSSFDAVPRQLPEGSSFETTASALAQQRRQQASRDIDGLEAAYHRDSGGDDPHQVLVAAEWRATYEDRVRYRDVLLQHESPWRQQFMYVEAHRRLRQRLGVRLEDARAWLTAPRQGLGERLIARFDQATSVGAVGADAGLQL